MSYIVEFLKGSILLGMVATGTYTVLNLTLIVLDLIPPINKIELRDDLACTGVSLFATLTFSILLHIIVRSTRD